MHPIAGRETQDCSAQIRNSLFGEPPTFAIWLEDPISRQSRTVFVTRRAGTGDWVGKASCYAALPRWYQVFKEETGYDDYPTKGHEAPDAVTGATPKKGTFTIRTKLPAGSRWYCYVEMNLSGDFNDDYMEFNDETFEIDEHKSGQPPLLFRFRFSSVCR